MSKLNSPIPLPCGAQLENRFVKSAMSENMAQNLKPGPEFENAYKMWVDGQVGLLISGNVMIDSRHLGEPNNVVIEKGRDCTVELKKWADTAKGSQSKIWLQLNHPGKQSPKFLNKSPVAPSPIPLGGSLKSSFHTPRELTTLEIKEIVGRFGYAARIAQECGFHGVQIHGAHGYLVSQFLSPHHNQRTDDYGGALKNRMRFVVEVYEKMRQQVGPSFPIGIKINSADFSKGGFTNEEAIEVAETLSELKIDMIEVSGGTYEAPVMTGVTKESTRKREAYFIEYTKGIKKVIQCPLLVTGGFRSREFMEEVLQNDEVDLVGLARPLAVNPYLCKEILDGHRVQNQIHPLSTGFKTLDKIFPLEIIWYTQQIHQMGKNRIPNPHARVFPSIFKTIFEVGVDSLKRMRA